MRARSLVLGAVMVLGACGGEDPSGPSVGPPSSFQVTAGTNQQAAVGTALATSPSVRLVDANGRGVSGRSVRFDVIGGGGSVTGDSVVTDADGRATVGSWLLGPIPGVNQLRVQALGTPITAIIEATAQVGAPSQVTIIDGAAGLSAIVGQEVSPRPSLRFRDAFGNPVPGVAVTFTVTAGGGTVTGAQVTTNADGRATVGSWRLGPSSGVNRLQATTANGVGTVFIAQGIGIPAALQPVSPVDQAGLLRFTVEKTPRVKVVDSDGRPIAGVPVQFALAPGGDAAIAGATATSDSNGIAALGDWRLRNVPTSTVIASVPGFPALTTEFRASGVARDFVIDVRFGNQFDADFRDAFVTAALRWMEIIVGDLPDRFYNAGGCFGFVPALNETIDDIVIYAQLFSESPGGVLGRAGPCANSRRANAIPSYGGMEFDTFDLANLQSTNRLLAVIIHEMGHVLGIGSLWTEAPPNGFGLIVDAGTDDPIFTGPQTVAAWPQVGSSYTGRIVPVEGGPPGNGTNGSHWRESLLGAELMTGFVQPPGVPMPVSILTVSALADFGYTVDVSKADPFVAGLRAAINAVNGEKLPFGDDILR
ncbi:MAG TPA: Ig-like domain-containing protein [Gemmatimonadales bacterium]|nr:Ig-like domain-containing protein [Gemmatimonadales bacterium]